MSAKSRLNPKLKKSLLKNQLRQSTDNNVIFRRYLLHLPLLILSAPFYFVLYYILVNVYPKSIADFPLYNCYLGLLFPLFLANFFSLSYLLLNLKRGLSFSLLITVLVFLKLQQFIFEYWWFVPLVIFFVIVDQLIKIKSKDEKLTSKTRQSSRESNKD